MVLFESHPITTNCIELLLIFFFLLCDSFVNKNISILFNIERNKISVQHVSILFSEILWPEELMCLVFVIGSNYHHRPSSAIQTYTYLCI